MIIEYVKVRHDVVDPTRGNPADAGLDVYYCPPDHTLVYLQPGGNALLPTGLRFGVPHGYMLQVMNRSSVAAKRNLIVGAHVVDSGYDGEVFVDMHNIGTEEEVITPQTKIAQIVLIPIVAFRAQKAGGDDLYNTYPISLSDRGNKSLGSTDQGTYPNLSLFEPIDYGALPEEDERDEDTTDEEDEWDDDDDWDDDEDWDEDEED
jgi:dUTP pyrophosphatase